MPLVMKRELESLNACFFSGKSKRVGSKPLKEPAKAETVKDLRAASSKNMLGKRVRKETESTPSKRHQSLNMLEHQAGVPCNSKSPQAVILSRYGCFSFCSLNCRGFLRFSN
jgi:hypothetical protein